MRTPAALESFHGKIAIVTGGASGIGLAISRIMARQGAFVVLADMQALVAESEAEKINGAGGQAVGVPLDVTKPHDVRALIEEVARDHGRLDYLFNNAGIGVAGEAAYYELEDWLNVLDVNLNGVIYGIQAAYPIMRRQGHGHIINTASMAGLLPAPNVLSYTTSKHAVVGLSQALRIEAEEYGVRVSVFCPGVIRTPIITGGKYGRSVGPVGQSAMTSAFERLRPMDVDLFAERALVDVAKNKAIIIHPAKWRWIWRLHRLWPGLGTRFGKQSLAQIRKLSQAERESAS